MDISFVAKIVFSNKFHVGRPKLNAENIFISEKPTFVFKWPVWTLGGNLRMTESI